MTELGAFPPGEEAQAALAGVPGMRFTPGAVMGLEGPLGDLGPEAAGCVMVLHATFVDAEGADRFWDTIPGILEAAREAPGLIRLIAFGDGLSGYTVGFWKTEDEAKAFAREPVHREAVREQYETGYQYTQFAALWSPMTSGHRHVYCEDCGARTPMPAEACDACGNPVVDVFRT